MVEGWHVEGLAPGAGNLYGGIEVGLTTMARLRHLAPAMESEFGLCFRGRLWDELVATGAAVHDLGPVRLSRRGWCGGPAGGWDRFWRTPDPTVVVTHDCWPHTVFAPVVRGAGIGLVHFVHGQANGRHWLERLASRTPSDLVVANSQFTAESVGSVFPGTRAEVWHYPVARPA